MTAVTEPTTRAWASRDFRRLWAGSAVSTFGSEVAELAVPLLAIGVLAATPGELGALRTAQFLPFLLATLPLGMLVDRRRRLPLMVGADVGRFALILVIPLAVWAGFAEIELLYVVMFLAGVLTVLYQVADFAFVPEVVTPHQLVDANGKLAAAQSANEIGARGFGGLLVQAASAPVAMLVNAVTYLVSAFSLRGISVVETTRPTASARPSWAEVTAGLREALRNRYVRALLGEATTFNLFNEVFILGLMLFTVREVGLSPIQIGIVFTAGGVGSFLGAWFGARVTGRFGYGRVLLVTLILGNTAPVLVALAGTDAVGTLVLFCSVFVVMGVGIGIANVHAVSLRQAALPEELRGRVNAAYRLISWGAIPVGATLGGVLAAVTDARTAMVAGASGMVLATLWVAFSPVRRLASIDEAARLSRAGDPPRTAG
ncbi:MFS transporter [Jiangella mangrovi]|uniref:MFS family permease n=1 Tax=Jiangella mangrovi TaxID=1524084 RepID=A0A7W9GQI3_9ACTN|nr:MFS transporter [Jiangella mangrovi]MBB5788047.1 MFS family permease [Jiangella mangrovi]